MIRCLMIGVGAYTFVDDWALAASSVSDLHGMRSVVDQPPWRLSPVVVPGVATGIRRYDVHRPKVRGAKWVPRIAESIGANAIVAVAEEIERTAGPVDLIHSHFYSASVGVRRAAKLLGIPYVHTEHSSRLVSSEKGRVITRTGLDVLRRVAAGASTVFVVSESLREAMVARGIDARYEVLGNPVDASLFSAQPHASGVPPRLVTIGGLVPNKRHELLLRAFALVVEFQPGATLTIIGDGPLRMRLEALAADLGIATRVRFVGWIERLEVARELCGTDVYVHGSVVETFGVSIVEALLSAVPVVTTACGGVLGGMPASLPVTVVDPASPEVLADAIRATLADACNLDREAVVATAAARFGLDPVSRRLVATYDSAVKG